MWVEHVHSNKGANMRIICWPNFEELEGGTYILNFIDEEKARELVSNYGPSDQENYKQLKAASCEDIFLWKVILEEQLTRLETRDNQEKNRIQEILVNLNAGIENVVAFYKFVKKDNLELWNNDFPMLFAFTDAGCPEKGKYGSSTPESLMQTIKVYIEI
jgi:hypothetical protein